MMNKKEMGEMIIEGTDECYAILRKRNRETICHEEISKEEMTQHEYSDLYQKLMELEIEYRLPLVLYYLNQYTVKEISQILNLGESAVKMRLSRGRKKMRQMYEQEDTV